MQFFKSIFLLQSISLQISCQYKVVLFQFIHSYLLCLQLIRLCNDLLSQIFIVSLYFLHSFDNLFEVKGSLAVVLNSLYRLHYDFLFYIWKFIYLLYDFWLYLTMNAQEQNEVFELIPIAMLLNNIDKLFPEFFLLMLAKVLINSIQNCVLDICLAVIRILIPQYLCKKCWIDFDEQIDYVMKQLATFNLAICLLAIRSEYEPLEQRHSYSLIYQKDKCYNINNHSISYFHCLTQFKIVDFDKNDQIMNSNKCVQIFDLSVSWLQVLLVWYICFMFGHHFIGFNFLLDKINILKLSLLHLYIDTKCKRALIYLHQMKYPIKEQPNLSEQVCSHSLHLKIQKSQKRKKMQVLLQTKTFQIYVIDFINKRIAIIDKKCIVLDENKCSCEKQDCIHLLWLAKNDVFNKFHDKCVICHGTIIDRPSQACLTCFKCFHPKCIVTEELRRTCCHCKSDQVSTVQSLIEIDSLPDPSLIENKKCDETCPLRQKGIAHCWNCALMGAYSKSCPNCTIV